MGPSGGDVSGRNGGPLSDLIARLAVVENEQNDLRAEVRECQRTLNFLVGQRKGTRAQLDEYKRRLDRLSTGVKDLSRASHHDLESELQEFRKMEKERVRYWVRYAVVTFIGFIVAIGLVVLGWVLKR